MRTVKRKNIKRKKHKTNKYIFIGLIINKSYLKHRHLSKLNKPSQKGLYGVPRGNRTHI